MHHILHTTLAYLNVIPINSLKYLWCFGKCLPKSFKNILSMWVFMLGLNGRLNHKMFMLRFLLWGGYVVNLLFSLKPAEVANQRQLFSKHSFSHEILDILLLVMLIYVLVLLYPYVSTNCSTTMLSTLATLFMPINAPVTYL